MITWREFLERAAMSAAVVTVFLILCAVLGFLRAAPPPDARPEFSDWYQSLMQPNGTTSCCSLADCRPTSYRVVVDHYEVVGFNSAGEISWLPVPPDRVLHRFDNPTGRAVACIQNGNVLCFVKASES